MDMYESAWICINITVYSNTYIWTYIYQNSWFTWDNHGYDKLIEFQLKA